MSSLTEQRSIEMALQSLKEISARTLAQISGGERRFWHWHEVNFEETTRPEGFGIPALSQAQAFQFAMNGINNQRCRAVGALIDGVFYIVWVDTMHQLIPAKKKHT